MNQYEREEKEYAFNYFLCTPNHKAVSIVRGTLKHFKFKQTRVIVLTNRNQMPPKGFVGIWFYGTIGSGSALWESKKIRLSNSPPLGLIAHEIAHLLCAQHHKNAKPHGKEFEQWNRRVQQWVKRYRS